MLEEEGPPLPKHDANAIRDYVIIIGAMKSGTTTLFDMLAQHPAIAPARNKEPGFFALDEVWERGWGWYDSLFDVDPARHRYRLEASTDYTKAPFTDGNVWTRMTARPDVSMRLIYIMRDPIRRLESHARHVQRTRKEIGQRLSLRDDHGLDAGLSPVSLAISDYAAQLDAFEDARQQGRLHLVTLDELQSEPMATLVEIYGFLGLENYAVKDVSPRNVANTKTQIPKFWSTLLSTGFVSALGRYFLSSTARDALKDKLAQRVQLSGRFAFTEAEEAALDTLFHPGIERLQQDYDIEVRPVRYRTEPTSSKESNRAREDTLEAEALSNRV